HYVKQDIGSPPDIERALAITRSVPVDIRILGPGKDWASDPNFQRMYTLDFGRSPRFSNDPDAWVDELQGLEFAVAGRHRFLKIVQGDYDIVVATPRIADVTSGPDLMLIIIGLGLFYLMIGYAAVSWLFKPIKAVRMGAEQIGRGNFDHRIRDIRQDQLGDLASDINKLADDVEHMLDAKRALLLGISHELRTPLSRMRLGLEFIDSEDDRETLKPEIVEMEKIVVSLLEAERLSTRHVKLNRTTVRINELVDELLDDFFDRDRGRINVRHEGAETRVHVDEARITLLLKNLIANALRYVPEDDGRVELTTRVEGQQLILRVRDNGPGMSREQARHIGEPFYRVDPSRTRGTGGTGMGLYLATLVARAHGGSIELTNPDEDGACFECRIPAGLPE
ncbi:MAG: HAMP domain-containing histidine kinase, partial [Gammaproteobacteria bacterium]|nr:HAMP domain-containing histidine kinase [Gammaproteobacteria bacterium]